MFGWQPEHAAPRHRFGTRTERPAAPPSGRKAPNVVSRNPGGRRQERREHRLKKNAIFQAKAQQA